MNQIELVFSELISIDMPMKARQTIKEKILRENEQLAYKERSKATRKVALVASFSVMATLVVFLFILFNNARVQQRRIVYATGAGSYEVVIAPKPGEVIIGGDLKAAMENPNNEHALFYVCIKPHILNPETETKVEVFTFEGLTIDQWYIRLGEYNKGLNEFYQEKINRKPDYTADDKRAWEEEWVSLNGETPDTQLSMAIKTRYKKLCEWDGERLSQYGIKVEIKEFGVGYRMYALLTKEQIRTFPVGEGSYSLLFARQNGDTGYEEM